MSNEFPKPPTQEAIAEQQKREILSLARELSESNETFPFPGLAPGSYEKLKAAEEECPGYGTPIDEQLERFRSEGMKVTLGQYPESGNVYIIPAQSTDIENDMLLFRHFNTAGELDERLKKLLENYK